jgi:hypothetical protein
VKSSDQAIALQSQATAIEEITELAAEDRVRLIRIAFLAVIAIPNLRVVSHANCECIAFHVDNGSFFPGFEIPDLAQIAVCDCLTDVDQPFCIHLIQSLLWQVKFPCFLHEEALIFQLEKYLFIVFNVWSGCWVRFLRIKLTSKQRPPGVEPWWPLFWIRGMVQKNWLLLRG